MQKIFSGTFTSSAGATETITLGCDPAFVKVVNVTTNVIYEYINDGTNIMGTSLAGATGVVTQSDTTIVKTGNGFTVDAGALTTSDVVYYIAYRLE